MIAVLQIYLMNAFLSSKTNSFYGYEILKTILKGEADLVQQSDSKIFNGNIIKLELKISKYNICIII